MKDFIKIGIGLLIGAALMFLFSKSDRGKQYWEDRNFKPDTVEVPVYRPLIIPGSANSIPPEKVVIYQDKPIYQKPETIYSDTGKIRLVYKDRETSIDHSFLTYEPGAPKLLKGAFVSTGFKLDLLDTSGNLYTVNYPTDYSQYNYYYDRGTVLVDKLKKVPDLPNPKRNFSTSSNLYLTYELTSKTPMASVDYSLNFKRVGLYGLAGAGYSNNILQTNLNAGVRIRLK